MSHPIATYEPVTNEMYDWHHTDIINKAPYDDYEMVMALTEGRFVIEGKQSTIEDAWNFVEARDTEEAWKAWDIVDNQEAWDQYLALDAKIIDSPVY